MRPLHSIVSAAIAVALFDAGAAYADDPARTRAGLAPPAVAFNWTGCYLGGYLGGATQSREVNAWEPMSTGGVVPARTFYDPMGSAHPLHKVDIGEFNYNLDPGAIGGGTLGCNWQGAYPIVLGVEGEGGYMKLAGSTLSPYSVNAGTSDTVASTRIGDWYAAASARFGYAWDRALLYLKGGVGFVNVNSSVIDSCSAAPCSPGLLTAAGSSSQPYWVAGAGVEYAVNNSWSIKGEFLNLGMYKRFEVCGPGAAAAAGSTFCGIHAIEGVRTYKLGVNYHFNTLNGAGY
jgi:outer membrane immunogenic protein